MLPPPESSKSRHSKQLKPPDENYSSTAAITTSADSLNKTKATADDEWLRSGDVMKLGKTNQSTTGNENKNGLKLSNSASTSEGMVAADDTLLQTTTSATISTSASHYIDAFSDLDPLGTGKIRPYIDKKYFFQDLKNPPKKVLKDLSDRDGFSTTFSPDSRKSKEFTMFQDKSVQDLRKKSEQSDEFVTQFSSSTQIFSPNNNGTHGTPPNLSQADEGKCHEM